MQNNILNKFIHWILALSKSKDYYKNSNTESLGQLKHKTTNISSKIPQEIKTMSYIMHRQDRKKVACFGLFKKTIPIHMKQVATNKSACSWEAAF